MLQLVDVENIKLNYFYDNKIFNSFGTGDFEQLLIRIKYDILWKIENKYSSITEERYLLLLKDFINGISNIFIDTPFTTEMIRDLQIWKNRIEKYSPQTVKETLELCSSIHLLYYVSI
jgi:hypothetical protein